MNLYFPTHNFWFLKKMDGWRGLNWPDKKWNLFCITGVIMFFVVHKKDVVDFLIINCHPKNSKKVEGFWFSFRPAYSNIFTYFYEKVWWGTENNHLQRFRLSLKIFSIQFRILPVFKRVIVADNNYNAFISIEKTFVRFLIWPKIQEWMQGFWRTALQSVIFLHNFKNGIRPRGPRWFFRNCATFMKQAGKRILKSKPYLRFKNSKRTSKCQVFSSTVPEWGKNFPNFCRIFLVAGKLHSGEKCKRGPFRSFWTSILLQNRKKLKGDPLETLKVFAKKRLTKSK